MADAPKVTFTDEIPKIEREGGKRRSKYADLIEACVERPGKAARMTLESQGKASARASSIRTAADKHPHTKSGEGHFTVATRSGQYEDGETEYYVYVQYDEGPAPEKDEDEDEETPKPKKKVAKKRAKKA